jgi:REP-associated tyrosine transposase
MYHIVCPAKYRKVIFSEEADKLLKEICIEIEKRYEIYFLEIGADKNHVHFFVQSVPTYSPKKIVQIIKSITAREMFEKMPEIKEKLWGGEFWSKGYFINTVGKHGGEENVAKYVRNQGKMYDGYKVMHSVEQLVIIDENPMI